MNSPINIPPLQFKGIRLATDFKPQNTPPKQPATSSQYRLCGLALIGVGSALLAKGLFG